MKLFTLTLALFVFSSIKAEDVTTFDFTKIENGTICGVDFTPDTGYNDDQFYFYYYPKNEIFSAGECFMTIKNIDSKDSFLKLSNIKGDAIIFKSNGAGFTIKSANGFISKIEISYSPGTTMENWSCDTDTFDWEKGIWTGSSHSVTFTSTENKIVGISSIKVTTRTSDQVGSDTKINDLESMDDGAKVKFNGILPIISQSYDKKHILVCDNNNLMYIHSATGDLSFASGQAIASGLEGTKTTTDGIITLEANDETINTVSSLSPVEKAIDELDDDLVGRLVLIKDATIKCVSGIFSATQGTSTVVLKDVMMNDIAETATGKVASITGVLGKDGSNYVVHPLSLVITDNSELGSVIRKNITVETSNKTILINGEWKHSSVYTLEGRMVAEDKAQITCESGIYIVNVDGDIAVKVILK